MAIVVGWAVLAWGAPGPGQEAPPDADQDQDLAAALAELDAAGAPPTGDELAVYLAEATDQSRGQALLRGGWTDGAPDATGRLTATYGWGGVWARWRQPRTGGSTAGGALQVDAGRWRICAGGWGATHGFGLLVHGPGRGPALTADGRLGSPSGRLVRWTGDPQPQALQGVAVAWRRGFWRPLVLVGRRAAGEAGRGPSVIGRLAAEGGTWQVAALAVRDPDESGASLTGSWRVGSFAGSWEVAGRRPRGSSRVLTAVLGHGDWRPLRSLRGELLAGWADAGPRPVFGQKHPIFGDWGGRGWCLRGAWRPVPGASLQVLHQRGLGRPERPDSDRLGKQVTDILVGFVPAPGWDLAARWRSRGTETAGWSERFPWLPPTPLLHASSSVASLTVVRSDAGGRWQVAGRRLREEAGGPSAPGWQAGTRRLLTIGCVRFLGDRLTARASWTTSWGEPVDLVNAVVPFGGYVLPRHWGRWRSEHLVGVEWAVGPWRLRGAGSWRQADRAAGTDQPDSWQAWCEFIRPW